MVFLDFSETVLCKEVKFFALHSVNQNSSFELSKSTRTIFPTFTIRIGQMVFKVFFLDFMAFPLHLNVRLKTFSWISIEASALVSK